MRATPQSRAHRAAQNGTDTLAPCNVTVPAVSRLTWTRERVRRLRTLSPDHSSVLVTVPEQTEDSLGGHPYRGQRVELAAQRASQLDRGLIEAVGCCGRSPLVPTGSGRAAPLRGGAGGWRRACSPAQEGPSPPSSSKERKERPQRPHSSRRTAALAAFSRTLGTRGFCHVLVLTLKSQQDWVNISRRVLPNL